MDIYTDMLKETKTECEEFLEKTDYQFCIVKDCDPNFSKLRLLSKGFIRPPKRKTFTDCQRKDAEELKEYYEVKKRYKKGNWKKNK